MFRKLVFLLFLISFLLTITAVSTVKADAIERLETNLNMSISDIIIILLSCGIVVIGAFDARIAIMCALLLYASAFIVFTLATEEGYSGFNPYYSGVAMMLCFVILCISLLISYKKGNTPMQVA